MPIASALLKIFSTSAFISRATTAAPFAFSIFAIERPIPLAAPVTRAIFPLNSDAFEPPFSFACSSDQYPTSKIFAGVSALYPPSFSAFKIAS